MLITKLDGLRARLQLGEQGVRHRSSVTLCAPLPQDESSTFPIAFNKVCDGVERCSEKNRLLLKSNAGDLPALSQVCSRKTQGLRRPKSDPGWSLKNPFSGRRALWRSSLVFKVKGFQVRSTAQACPPVFAAILAEARLSPIHRYGSHTRPETRNVARKRIALSPHNHS